MSGIRTSKFASANTQKKKFRCDDCGERYATEKVSPGLAMVTDTVTNGRDE